jgi:aspartyl aminopeptidase
MRYRFLETPDRIRQKFRETFVLPYDALHALYPGWAERYDENHYKTMYL